MESFLISFHLNNQEDYAKVSEQIRSYPKWARIVDNVWIVLSDNKLTEIRESISSLIDSNGGSVLVVKVTHAAWATYSVEKEVTDWMKENI